MTAFFIAPDASSEPTLWIDNGLMPPTPLATRSIVGGLAWALLETHPEVTVREVIA